MPIEQRVISSSKIGAKNAQPAAGLKPAEEPPAKGKGKRVKLLVLGAVLLVVLGAAAAYLGGVFDRGAAAEPSAPPPPTPGEVLAVEPVSLNLAGGHYLRIGLGLQLTTDVHEAPDPSKAVDVAIALFSGRSMEEVSDPATRDALKAQLAEQLVEVYEGEVMDVYLTNFVTQ
ncbi:flagellar basal body-associated FliL family protein [Cellulomonas chengniuliangii]|uniref:Flagellar protein FliL n=1 Tax=Cellulomonas chengniuliangii TaxID=2968084 RepID=A0ABY5L215_9CELL|nr:flagellar basal body-associated FliL family protein [Cellulomonas chengniuliangii]MCC2307257.1 flagellar basal body-associated FliL family protein [Cellulomonas chengniuliangii]MCC2317847.1 flagellar basal body-associated FliL family protein [Cellulomonas chengniuliangii]UUI75948.1 flagellar basal body-associated FliL family protein [Cellulomonas chengniuliangii]